MSTCAAPAGSPCRTGKGRVAVQYHTARFRLVPSLAKALTVPPPRCASPDRPGSSCPGRRRPTTSRPGTRGSATRAPPLSASRWTPSSTPCPRQVARVFAEKVSTRPELDNASPWPRRCGPPASRSPWSPTSTSGSAEDRAGRARRAARAAGIGLEFLTGELQGSHDPSGIVFTVLAALSGMEREYIRDRTLEGHESARARGKASAAPR